MLEYIIIYYCDGSHTIHIASQPLTNTRSRKTTWREHETEHEIQKKNEIRLKIFFLFFVHKT